VLVFTQTGSGLLTVGVYALTYRPGLLGSIGAAIPAGRGSSATTFIAYWTSTANSVAQ